MPEPGVDAPSWWRDYVLYEKFTLIDAREMRQRRATWPRWRRALRPIGAALWWGGITLAFFYQGLESPRTWLERAIAIVLAACLLGAIVIGVGLEWRDRAREGRRIFD